MLRWEITGFRLLLPLMVVVQFLFGAGFVLGIGLFFAEIPPRSAFFLTTGAGVITLIVVGLVLGPQLIAGQKQQGTYDFMWSLPVPRSAATAAWVALSVMIALPGLIGALALGFWRFDLDLSIGWDIVPAVTVTLVTATLLGYALAHAIPNPEITQILSQLLIFVVVGFAPINFPPENLPAWLADLHELLPFTHMARVVRAALTDGLITDVARSYFILAAWALIALGIVGAVLRSRK
jgi:ABC-2 type transport system permease protein